MLHSIDDEGNISWYCRDPLCRYHSCQNWDVGVHCIAHPDRSAQGSIEEAHIVHISDPAIRWTGPDVISLPECGDCGMTMAIRVHREHELIPPLIARDELTGKIVQVAPNPHPLYAMNLWQTHIEVTRKKVPHETLAHLSTDQIEELQTHNRSKAPMIPVEWMLTEAIHVEIKAVTPHPAIKRHQSLAEQLSAIGKSYGLAIEEEEDEQSK